MIMIKLTRIDAWIIFFAAVLLLPRLNNWVVQPSTIGEGVYIVVHAVVIALLGIVVIQLISNKNKDDD